MEKKKPPKTVRFDPEQHRRISLLANQLSGASFAQALRTVIGKGLDALEARPLGEVAEPPGHYGDTPARGVLLVEEGVGAGHGQLPIIPAAERPYFFREDWLRARGWTPEHPDRLVCIRLGSSAIADSMYPTIQPESVLLVDREPDRRRIAERSIWLVEIPREGLAVKRLTVTDETIILESDNPEREYAPRAIHERYTHAEFETMRAAAALAESPHLAALGAAVAGREPAKPRETRRKGKGRGIAPASA